MVMPTTHDRLALVEAGRTWRKGLQVRTSFHANVSCHTCLPAIVSDGVHLSALHHTAVLGFLSCWR